MEKRCLKASEVCVGAPSTLALADALGGPSTRAPSPPPPCSVAGRTQSSQRREKAHESGSQQRLPGALSPGLTRLRLVPPAATCSNTCELSPSGKAAWRLSAQGCHWGLITWPPPPSAGPDSRRSEEADTQHNPRCVHRQPRPSGLLTRGHGEPSPNPGSRTSLGQAGLPESCSEYCSNESNCGHQNRIQGNVLSKCPLFFPSCFGQANHVWPACYLQEISLRLSP